MCPCNILKVSLVFTAKLEQSLWYSIIKFCLKQTNIKHFVLQRISPCNALTLRCPVTSKSSCSQSILISRNTVWCAHDVLCLKPTLARVRTMHWPEASARCSVRCVLTRTNAFDRKCGLGQEVWVGEHVFFIDHKAQEGEFWFVHGESHQICSFPRRVEAVVTCGGRKDRTPSHLRHHRPRSGLHCPVSTASRGPLFPRPSLTVDNGLALLVCVATQLHLHERTGDAAGGLGKVPGGENLRRRNCYRENIWRFGVASGSVPYLDVQVIPNALLFLLRVVVVLAHELRLQHVARASVQTEEGAVQLGVFIWKVEKKAPAVDLVETTGRMPENDLVCSAKVCAETPWWSALCDVT